ncbi:MULTISPECIES: putative 2-aminoethylphosphonate ABC transporter permease subunit [Halomonadaceae]|uniref:putative 2-aminoethylphosphonate ABC transporter permease subunit n=1 Tax=Halomonadaceae TaxID=28256 RepID=UPI00158208FE|nr:MULTISPECIES: putative 2-aminoethylphosphonate ABC transporter permease subunit [Halomonas]MDI4638502.1 putative 2-aminoethylphosphonate ABC transporter permease subunit [Halomonas sp. BMC7]NUJ59488.1 putative 2-aminoethylphosphonate ABC transporter permease subunit [Halomonas taeanensis]
MMVGMPSWSRRWSGESLIRLLALLLALGLLVVGLLFPLAAMLVKSVQDRAGDFVGLANFARYVQTPALAGSIVNSLTIALTSTAVVVGLAFLCAYGLTRTCMPGKRLFRMLAILPILAPSLLPAISLVYLFGNQGWFREVLMGESIYGPIGIVMGLSFWIFPHALMILVTALSNSDARLYEAAEALGTPKWRSFFTITLPGARYGLISCGFVAFTLAITDFGVPKIIGGQFSVLATDVYRQVVGQQNFQMGAVVSVILLLPALLSFVVDRWIQRRQVAQLSARAVPWQPSPSPMRDWTFATICYGVGAIILLVIGTAIYASLVQFWPYNLSLTFKHYAFEALAGGGWTSWGNSLKLAFSVATIGTLAIFFNAWLIEKSEGYRPLRQGLHFLAMLPMAVPGMVLGLAYIFFFNQAGNPLNWIYGTLIILVLNTLVHFYTVCHLTSVTALKQLDPEFEAVGASLKVPFWTTFYRVTLPVSLPAVLDISVYLFVNAMTTVSAVVFLYTSDTRLASVAVMHLNEAGYFASAAAMAVLIFFTSLGVKLAHAAISHLLLTRAQRWRQAG